MTTAEKKIEFLFGEIRILKARLERLVPLDDEGDYRDSFLKKLNRSRASKTRFIFRTGGSLEQYGLCTKYKHPASLKL